MNKNSNLSVCSNVYLRKEDIHPTADIDFNKKITGREALKVMLRAKYGYDVRIDEVNHLSFLTEKQISEFKSLRCPRCKRLDFGYIMNNAGKIKWRMLEECFCQQAERHQ